MHRDRFAPSPTGLLHLGHAFSALAVWDSVQRQTGEFVLRIEDIDTARSRPEFEEAIFDDLAWLGLEWREPVMRQSTRLEAYSAAVRRLTSHGLCYPCRCTRSDIRTALSAPQEHRARAGKPGIGNPPYPGLCRSRSMADRSATDAVRLDMARAIRFLGGAAAVNRLWFDELGASHAGRHHLGAEHLAACHGDIVISRRDTGASYHLAVVVDDAEQQITQVTRGEDLFGVTAVHRLLQELLSLPAPVWNHHRLIRDRSGKRLAKRHDSQSLRSYRSSGHSPDDIRALADAQIQPQSSAAAEKPYQA